MYKITSKKKSINWNAKGKERVLQNVTNLLNTFMYEVAYNRIMGRNPDNVDKPLEEQIPSIIAETYEIIEDYEPRAKVLDVKVIIENNSPVIEVVVDIE